MAQGSVSTGDKAVVEKALSEAKQYLKEVTPRNFYHHKPHTAYQMSPITCQQSHHTDSYTKDTQHAIPPYQLTLP